jgi:molybdopterin synthase catalytic subunit
MGTGARKGISPDGSLDESAIGSNTSCVTVISVVDHLGYADQVTSRHFVDSGDTWLELTEETLDVGAAYSWAVQPSCGAVVVFSGTVRDHSEGRDGVEVLTYEAYDEAVVTKLTAVAAEIRRQWAAIGRIALIHRVGELRLGESSVLVVVSAPHRPEAFEAARFGIDALKATVPIWKRETWKDGGDWAQSAQHVTDLATFSEQRLKATR